jgi:hypothetical protein
MPMRPGFLLAFLLLYALALPGAPARAQSAAGPWRALFDGTSLAAWRGYRMTTVPPEWKIVDGALTKTEKTVDLVSRDVFGDFELELDWKIGRGGNSGILYRGNEMYDHVYMTAPEYQLLDDLGAEDNKSASHIAGALYDLISAPGGYSRPVGFWNETRLIVRGNTGEHWLNGVRLLRYEMGSGTWKAAYESSKFSKGTWPKEFATLPSGHLAIQGDHDGELSLRNIRVRELR